jgi:hypothetical protein
LNGAQLCQVMLFKMPTIWTTSIVS